MLANTFFAGDRATLLGRDDLLLRLLELGRDGAQTSDQRVPLGERFRTRLAGRARRVDAIGQNAHLSEHRLDAGRRFELLLSIRLRVWSTAIETDGDLGLDDVRSFGEAHG